MNKELTQEGKSLLTAIVLGDGCLRKPHPQTGSVQLEIGHSIKQEDYCIWKRDLVFDICGGLKPPKIGYKKVILKSNNKEYETCRFTKIHEYFIHLRNKMYSNGRKIVSEEILNSLTLQGIAIWYMDDGSLYTTLNETGNKSIKFDLRFATDCFNKEEHDLLEQYFNDKLNINFRKYFKPNTNTWCLRGFKKATLEFYELISPYIINSMKYKIEFIK